MQLDRVRARAEETYGAQLVFDDGAGGAIAERARGTEIGARAVEQMISRELLPLLSRHFLERLGDGLRTSSLRVSLDGTGVSFCDSRADAGCRSTGTFIRAVRRNRGRIGRLAAGRNVSRAPPAPVWRASRLVTPTAPSGVHTKKDQ